MAHAAGYFHIHLISDATGETLITVARAAAAQYSKVMPVEHIHPLVRNQKQLDRVLADIEVDMPYPRHRASPRFAELRQRVIEALELQAQW